MSRLFVLGCSFSNYAWPSWADIIGLNYNEFENWAWPGLGNRALLERLTEIIVTKNLTINDTVIIQWTSHLRNDWHSTDTRHGTEVGWKTSGSIFNEINKDLYNKNWIFNFWDEASYAMHMLNYIHSAQRILDSIGCEWYMTSMGYIHKLSSDYPTQDETSAEKSKEDLNLWINVPALTEYKNKIFTNYKDKWIDPVGTCAWKSVHKPYKFKKPSSIKFYVDRHPSMLQHKEYAINKVLPKLNCSQKLHQDAEKWIDNIEECYINCHSNFNTFCSSVNWSNTYRGF